MARSIWKGPIFYKRSSTILPDFIGKSYPIHDGKTQKPIIITSLAVGLKLGELIFTKKVPKFKNKS